MAPLSVLICDDRSDEFVGDAVRKAATGAKVLCRNGDDLTKSLTNFFEGVRAFLSNEGGRSNKLPESDFDGFDIVIIDNNLSELVIPGARLTAESILGSLRAFTSSAYFISLNKNPQVDFDLRYLVGDYATHADQALNEPHLENPVLWTGRSEPGRFAPWYWPNLSEAADRRRAQIDFVEAHLDEAIVASLRIPTEVVHQLPSRAIGFLDPAASLFGEMNGTPIEATTFWHHFLSSNRSMPLDDRVAVVLGKANPDAATRKDFMKSDAKGVGEAVRRIAARIVSAELDMWFRRDLLGPQDLLADAPHLQMRLGFRPAGDDDLTSWNRACTEIDAPFGLDKALYDKVVSANRFEPEIWLPRPAFWLQQIEEHSEVAAFKKEGKREPTIAFMEDTRRFITTTNDRPPWRFIPENGAPWLPRFVEKLGEYNYSPTSSFAR